MMPACIRFFSGVAAACAFAAAAAQEPDLDLTGFWAVRFEVAPGGQALIDALPDDIVMIDDTGGGELGAGEFAGLQLTERAIAEVESYDYAAELDPENACNAPSVVFYMQAPFPMEIYQGRDLIVFKMEYFDMYRVVFLDATEHPPPDAPHSKSGHSVGHWEGDTLVVDTSHISSATFMNNGFSHSDDIHLTERFALSGDGSSLSLIQVYEDPATFEGRAARYMAWTRQEGEYVFPYECSAVFGN
jgi:hypothetical protein